MKSKSNFIHYCWIILIISGFAAIPAISQVVMDDFEGGTNQNLLGGFWYFYADGDDGGNSVINNATVNGAELVFDGSYGEGRDGSLHAAIMDYTLGDTPTPYDDNFVGLGGEFTGKTAFDITTATSITFWAKGSPGVTSLRVEVATLDITDYDYYNMLFTLTTTWTQYTIDFASPSFAQVGYGVATPFDPTQAHKMQFKIAASDGNITVGTVWIDDVVFNDLVYIAPSTCSGFGEPGQAVAGALLSDMDGAFGPSQNEYGQYWYAYNDIGVRVVGPGEYTDIFDGAVPDTLDASLVNIVFTEGTGYGGTIGAFIDFEFGPVFLEGANNVKPFAGVGTKLSDNLGLTFYNAAHNNATGLYFDYKTKAGSTLPMLVEVLANQDLGNPAASHYCLAPATNGEWKSVNIPFESLVLPEWEEVTALPEAAKALNTSALESIQWSVKGVPGEQASVSVDNVYFTGATGFENVFGRKRITNKLQLKRSPGLLEISLGEPVHNPRLEITDTRGGVKESFDLTGNWTNFNWLTKGLSSGIYHVTVTGFRKGKKVVYQGNFPYLN